MQGNGYLSLNEFLVDSYTFTHSIHLLADTCVAAVGEIVENPLQAEVFVN
jgi:hypothetical protein